MFAQQSAAAQARQKILESDTLSNALLSFPKDPTADNYDKYIVIATQSTDKAATLPNPIALYQQQKDALLSEDVISFLQSHVEFWNYFASATADMAQEATRLRSKIENN